MSNEVAWEQRKTSKRIDEEALRVRVEVFEGPLDLLLHLIQKEEIDIMDIPIAKITAQYMSYLELMGSLNLEVAGDFLLMAATLTQIKSKMLLPVEEGSEEEEGGEDPRAELVVKLLEYQRYKEAASALEKRYWLGRDVFKRGMASEKAMGLEVGKERPLTVPSLWVLVDALRDLLERVREEGQEIPSDPYSVFDQMRWILSEVCTGATVCFRALFRSMRDRAQMIATFLGLLELIRLQRIVVLQEGETGELLVSRSDESGEFLGKDEIDEYL